MRTKSGKNNDSTVLTKALNKVTKNHHNISQPQSQKLNKKNHTRYFGTNFFSGTFLNISGTILDFFLGQVFFFSRVEFCCFFPGHNFFFSGSFQDFFSASLKISRVEY